ncbi:Rab proteins geranylgeranyltransferase component A [Lambiella insularis]|nr:Rab proteins geranylgeranyltransferase component A [Lambiella insularis]
METLNSTEWDVVISGTGLPQSLLALALSRSGKKVLHVDRNDFYGGTDAALSLQDAEAWVKILNGEDAENDSSLLSPDESREVLPPTFQGAHITLPVAVEEKPESNTRLGYSRAYSLALSPQIIYARSALLPTLVSSKVHKQLEFLAVGSWWLYKLEEGHDRDSSPSALDQQLGLLKKIPGGREDVFADKTIDLKSKRTLMKLLRLAADVDAQKPLLEEWGDQSFQEFLTTQYGLSVELQSALHALTLSPTRASETKTSYALPRITRHLTSIGVFGPGFGSVVPKWGGLAEVAQVACRAGAVGGGVYVLGKAVEKQQSTAHEFSEGISKTLTITLQGGETVRTNWIAGSGIDLPHSKTNANLASESDSYISRSISIVSSSLSELFPVAAEGAPPPAVAVVSFPAGSIGAVASPPVYFMVHSSETGECPVGQCIIYATTALSGPAGAQLLELASRRFAETFPEGQRPDTLWRLEYSQLFRPPAHGAIQLGVDVRDSTILFKDSAANLAFDDDVLADVREAWSRVSGMNDGFMQFEDRETGAYDAEDS